MRRGIRLRGLKIVRNGRTGARYVYHRATGTRLPDLPENHPEFLAAFAAAEAGSAKPKERAGKGTIAWIVQDYMTSEAWRGLARNTQNNRRRIFAKIVEQRGHALFAQLMPRHIRKDISSLKPVPANNRLKCWRAACKYAVQAGLRDDNPAREVERYKVKETPHKRWEPHRVEQFRDHWPIGTPEREAFEIFYWTGARCCDARLFGPQHVTDGWLEFTQAKTGGTVSVPWTVLPGWARPFAEDQKHLHAALRASKDLVFIVTRGGAPRSEKGISNWMSAAARAAGLPEGYTAHGLRDTRCALLAEIGATALQLMTWSGHESLSEVQRYIQEADRKRAMRGENKTRKMENSRK